MDKKGFKIGDKVKILPSAYNGGVSRKDIGKVGMILAHRQEEGYFIVKMNNDSSLFGWAIYPKDLERVVRVGEQLQFAFMKGD